MKNKKTSGGWFSILLQAASLLGLLPVLLWFSFAIPDFGVFIAEKLPPLKRGDSLYYSGFTPSSTLNGFALEDFFLKRGQWLEIQARKAVFDGAKMVQGRWNFDDLLLLDTSVTVDIDKIVPKDPSSLPSKPPAYSISGIRSPQFVLKVTTPVGALKFEGNDLSVLSDDMAGQRIALKESRLYIPAWLNLPIKTQEQLVLQQMQLEKTSDNWQLQQLVLGKNGEELECKAEFRTDKEAFSLSCNARGNGFFPVTIRQSDFLLDAVQLRRIHAQLEHGLLNLHGLELVSPLLSWGELQLSSVHFKASLSAPGGHGPGSFVDGLLKGPLELAATLDYEASRGLAWQGAGGLKINATIEARAARASISKLSLHGRGMELVLEDVTMGRNFLKIPFWRGKVRATFHSPQVLPWDEQDGIDWVDLKADFSGSFPLFKNLRLSDVQVKTASGTNQQVFEASWAKVSLDRLPKPHSSRGLLWPGLELKRRLEER